MAKKQTEQVGFRMPAGWRAKILKASGLESLTDAILRALATTYGLKYQANDDQGGRPAKAYSVKINTPHDDELVRGVFDDHEQPWPVELDTVKTMPELSQTMVSVECGGVTENSLSGKRTKGAQLAAEIAAAIDREAARVRK